MTFQNKTLIFASEATGDDELLVRRLEGTERLSAPYRFELELVSEKRQLDLQKILYSPAKLGVREQIPLPGGGTGWTTHWIAGELESFAQTSLGQGWVGYRAVLVPRLARLGDSFRSRVVMDLAAPEIALRVLDAAGLAAGQDVELAASIQRTLEEDPEGRVTYPRREYVVQYEESDLAFVARWLEHEGIFYFFDGSDPDREKLVLADSPGSYRAVRGRHQVPFKPERATSHGDAADRAADSAIHTFEVAVQRLPREVVLNDYNWRTPEAGLRCSAEVDADGRGVQYEYNYHYKTTEQGEALAQVRAEALRCRGKVFQGQGDCRNLRPGFTFELTGHYRDDFNRSYLLTEVHHSAVQEISLESRTVTGTTYRTRFQAIPDDVPFRPAAVTPWPAIKGAMHAKVDAEGDGAYAELDAEGRYKVTIPFDQDLPERAPGRASRYVRMAQPYAGAEEGMHFPLRLGTEVLLTHIDGDPDRPIIAAAVPNPSTPSLVDTGNQSQSRIRTAGGNTLEFEDEAGREGIVMSSGTGSSYVCYTRPGSMGGGGGGGGGGAGGGGAAGRPARRAGLGVDGARGGDLPGPGLGSADETQSLTEQEETGANAFFNMSGFTEQASAGADAVKAAYAEVYAPGGVSPGADAVVGQLNAACSVFEGAIGKYELIVGGPHMEVKFGDVGEYEEGSRNVSKQVFSTILEERDPPSTGSGELKSKLGMNRRWHEIREEVDCDEYLATIGPAFGNYPNVVRESVRGVFVMDELWAQAMVLHLFGAPIVVDLDFAALGIHISSGVQFDISIGVNTSISIMENEIAVFNNEVEVTKNGLKVNQNEAAITDLKARVTTSEANITKNTADISKNEAAITLNKAAITDNTAKISDNQTAISQNKAAISDTKVAVTKNRAALKNTAAALMHNISGVTVQLGLP